ncbi:DUF190 domain-containing protein [Streptomyces sp. SID685]|uniref:DUF190 domain-containing protein n=1 Tax=Streptomyces TaxID=1883 RepID=UPI0013692A94|nr:DUF190 domain-containing protein [Streptomyces sp. SID685]MYR86295.1 DUF190 domain-containing protein [Streptomyces sp. SID685]
MTTTTAPGLRLTVLVGEDDMWHHKPLFAEIVHRAHRAGLSGAGVFRGVEGFGAVRAFLPQLDELVGEGLVTIDHREIVCPGGHDDKESS